MARVEPRRFEGQDVAWHNGAPIIFSRLAESEVSVGPKAGPTGRYRVDKRLYLLVAIRNRSARAVEVAESSVTVTCNDAPSLVVQAVDVENDIMRDAAWAQAMNSFASAVATSQAAHLPDKSAAWFAKRQVASDSARTAEDIGRSEQARLHRVELLLQRNTIAPEELLTGFVVLEPPPQRKPAWNEPSGVAVPRTVPCILKVSVTVAHDTHVFMLDEALSK